MDLGIGELWKGVEEGLEESDAKLRTFSSKSEYNFDFFKIF